MQTDTKPCTNIQSLVPLLGVASIKTSVRFYTELLGFSIVHRWEPEGKLRWCWITLGGASLMLQQIMQPVSQGAVSDTYGVGVCFYFQCSDAIAIYHDLLKQGVTPTEPQVGNGSWEVFLTDPDGFKLAFTSPTDQPEETLVSQLPSLS